MGNGISRNLLAAGIEVRAWNRSAEKIAELGALEGATVCASPAEAVRGAATVMTVLSDAEATLEVAGGEDGALAAAEPGATWVQAGTIGIEAIERCAEHAARRELTFVDSPVLGTKKPAEEGKLVVLASGPEQAQRPLEPVFDAIGQRTLWLGPAGAGTRMKLVINTWIVFVLEGTAETVALAEGLGVDPAQVLDIVAGGPLDLPYMRMKAEAIIDRDFTPSFRLALAAKDARLASGAGREADLDLPGLATIAERLTAAAREHGDEDMAAVYLATHSRPDAG